MSGSGRAAPERRVELLVMGLGNVLLRDDGVGVRAIEALEHDFAAPPGVEIADGGTLGLALLGPVSNARRVILVDAVASAAAPGTVVRLEGEAVEPAVRQRLSPHQVGVADLLDALRLIEREPEIVSLLGVVPEAITLGAELSASVEAALPELVASIVREASDLGYPLTPTGPRSSAAR